jgi:hypothetical protein
MLVIVLPGIMMLFVLEILVLLGIMMLALGVLVLLGIIIPVPMLGMLNLLIFLPSSGYAAWPGSAG